MAMAVRAGRAGSIALPCVVVRAPPSRRPTVIAAAATSKPSIGKAEVVAELAERIGKQLGDKQITQKDCAIIFDAFLATVQDNLLKGNKVSMKGFGTFEVKERPARKGRNVRTGETIDVAASRNAAFKPSAQLKDALTATMKK